MAALLLGSGVLHFVIPKPYDTIVPAELPGSQRFYTYASGVAELASGALLLSPHTRKFGALSAVALFLAVFPANVNMARTGQCAQPSLIRARNSGPLVAAAACWTSSSHSARVSAVCASCSRSVAPPPEVLPT